MPVRAIIKPAIYREWRFSCACRAIMISLKTPSCDRIFRTFGDFGEFVVKIAPVWHSLNYVLLREASLKHLTFKTVFLLAMASAARQ